MSAAESIVPLVDLRAQYATLKSEVDAAVDGVLARGDFILGEELKLFEAEFAQYCGAKFGVGVGSGTDALHLACRALDIGPGDEVIMPAFTFVATALGISLSGATPVLVDVDPRTALIDAEAVARAVRPETRAIMPVHFYGQCVDMDPLLELAEQHGLRIIEDAAQAHGATRDGRRAGALGDLGCFSFYPGKNLGAYGDGGLITVNDEDLAERLGLLRNWGSREKYHHEELGLNSRLDTIQAAILRVKLAHLDTWNNARRELASEYSRQLAEIDGIQLTEYSEGSIYHLYVIRAEDSERRDSALQALHESGIQAGIHYPIAVHELNAYKWLGYTSGKFPVAEDWARRCLTLPIYAEMPEEAVSRGAQVLQRC